MLKTSAQQTWSRAMWSKELGGRCLLSDTDILSAMVPAMFLDLHYQCLLPDTHTDILSAWFPPRFETITTNIRVGLLDFVIFVAISNSLVPLHPRPCFFVAQNN